MTLAIAAASWKPLVSLGFTAALLFGQLGHALPPMYSNHWAIYLGSFIALGFICGCLAAVAAYRGGANDRRCHHGVPDAPWRYGDGVGWFPAYAGDRWMLQTMAGSFCTPAAHHRGLRRRRTLLALFERGSLFRARELAQNSSARPEIDLIVEQERHASPGICTMSPPIPWPP
jgi:hypothetical protein